PRFLIRNEIRTPPLRSWRHIAAATVQARATVVTFTAIGQLSPSSSTYSARIRQLKLRDLGHLRNSASGILQQHPDEISGGLRKATCEFPPAQRNRKRCRSFSL